MGQFLSEGVVFLLLSAVYVMKHENFSYNCCSFLMFLVQHLFLISLNVNTIVNKYFLSMTSKCVAAFKVGWLIFEQNI